MDYFLLKKENNHMVVATYNAMGRTLMCNFNQRSVRALPIWHSFMSDPVSVSAFNRLYGLVWFMPFECPTNFCQ
jgi:hypothetical protein